jgi:transposase
MTTSSASCSSSHAPSDRSCSGLLPNERLRATPEQLCNALGACKELNAVYRRLLKMALEELRLIDEQIGELDKEMASLLSEHQDAVQRLAEVPGLGVDSAQQIIAEVGPTAKGPCRPRQRKLSWHLVPRHYERGLGLAETDA